MSRFLSIAIAFAFSWSLALGNADALLLCLHSDGSTHIIEQGEHSRLPTPDSCCSHSAPTKNSEQIAEFTPADCQDFELATPNLEELQTASAAKSLKAPFLFPIKIEDASFSLHSESRFTPILPFQPPLDQPSPSRLFAKTIQIRC